MQKITITVDLAKIDKTRIIERKYTTTEGQEVVAKEYKFEVAELKPENFKTIASGATWALVKKFFVADAQTKEERAAQTKTSFLGDGVVFVDLQPQDTAQPPSQAPQSAPQAGTNPQDSQDAPAITDSDIPF